MVMLPWEAHSVLTFIICLARSELESWHHLHHMVETIVMAPLVQWEQCLSGTLDLRKQLCDQAVGSAWDYVDSR